MDIKDQIKTYLDSGFTKADLEYLMGLPINSLSGFFAGGRKYSKKNELRILRWLASEDKPDPLTLEVVRKPKPEKKDNASEFETKVESQPVFKLEVKKAETPPIVNTVFNPTEEINSDISDIDERIAKLEERLLMPPKYLPRTNRNMVESELAALKKLRK